MTRSLKVGLAPKASRFLVPRPTFRQLDQAEGLSSFLDLCIDRRAVIQ